MYYIEPVLGKKKKLKPLKKIKGCVNCFHRNVPKQCGLANNRTIPDKVFYEKGCPQKKKGKIYF